MRFLATLFRNLSRHGAVERDLDEEVHAHFELLVDEYRATGMEDAAARRAARLELGGTGQVKDAVRDVRGPYARTLPPIRFQSGTSLPCPSMYRSCSSVRALPWRRP
jgi:hypothetical protein